MDDSDATSTTNEDRESHLVGCSVKGPSHEKENKRCQDNWDGTQLADSRFALAVADGLGSASDSHIGSEVASETVVEHLEQVVQEEDLEETSLRDAFKQAFKSARSALQDEADRQGLEIKDLNTTLLAAAGGLSGVAAAAVGDGGIIKVYRDQFDIFVPREESEYANRTTPIQSDHWEDSYRFEYSEQVDGVAAFTDGLENFAWDGKDEPQAALFEQFFNFVWYTTDADRITDELGDFLNHERYRNISDDDKTIAIATLDVDYEGREPLPNSEKSDQEESQSLPDSPEEADTGGATKTVGNKDNGVRGTTPGEGSTFRPSTRSNAATSNPETNQDVNSEKVITKTSKPAENSEERTASYEGEVAKAGGDTVHIQEYVYTEKTGVVYTTSSDEYPAVKIFDGDKRTEAKEAKLAAMVENQPKTPSKSQAREPVYQWPVAILRDYSEGTFLGCAFSQRAPTEGQSIGDFAANGAPKESLGSWVGSFINNLRTAYAGPRTPRYDTAIDLASVINALHKQGVAVCDFSPQKIVVTDGELIFTTCDRYALNDGSNFYSESNRHIRYVPEGDTSESIEESQYMDRFGLAVHLHRLLLKGSHPFGTYGGEGSVNEPLDPEHLNQHIVRDLSEIDVGENEEAKRYSDLPQMIRYQLERCFIEGFGSPEERPSARQWLKTLTEERR